MGALPAGLGRTFAFVTLDNKSNYLKVFFTKAGSILAPVSSNGAEVLLATLLCTVDTGSTPDR